MNPISIIILTYNRPEIIKRTIFALLKNIYYEGEIEYIVADDSTPSPTYHHHCLRFFPKQANARVECTPKQSGWGMNANNAMSKASNDIILMLEDDYVLSGKINLTPYVVLLQKHHSLGVVRLDGIAGHLGISCQIAQTDINDLCPTWQQGISYPGILHYFLIDGKSSHLNLYSNRPHLKHKRFHKFYGDYPEGQKLGMTETMFAHTVKDKMKAFPDDAPAIAVPLDANCYWDHIGVSWQGTEHDK